MKQEVKEKLRYALKAAKDSYLEAMKNSTEGDLGSFNLDTAVLILPYVKKGEIATIAQEFGMSADDTPGSGSRYFVWGSEKVSQSHNTIQAEAISKALKNAGFNSTVWYKAD